MKGALRGRLLEIKAPKSRQPGEFVPYEYYVQMQIQMEVADLEAVDFIEAQFKQRHVTAITEEDAIALHHAAWKGRIRVIANTVIGTLRYVYSGPVEDLEEVMEPQGPPALDEDEAIVEDSIWWLVALYPRTVLRNADWWSTVAEPAAAAFWKEVEAKRLAAVDTIELVPASPKWLGSR